MWYFVNDGQTEGPFSKADIAKLIREGVLCDEDLIWTVGMKQWKHVSEAISFPTPPPIPDGKRPSDLSVQQGVETSTQGSPDGNSQQKSNSSKDGVTEAKNEQKTSRVSDASSNDKTSDDNRLAGCIFGILRSIRPPFIEESYLTKEGNSAPDEWKSVNLYLDKLKFLSVISASLIGSSVVVKNIDFSHIYLSKIFAFFINFVPSLSILFSMTGVLYIGYGSSTSKTDDLGIPERIKDFAHASWLFSLIYLVALFSLLLQYSLIKP